MVTSCFRAGGGVTRATPAGQGMGAGRAVLEAPDMQARGFEVDLLTAGHRFPRPVGHA
jgi:hypothetical protein